MPCRLRYLIPSLVLILSTATAQLAAEVRGYYVGSIGDYAAQLDLHLVGENASGTYYYEAIGHPLSLVGTLDVTRLALVERDGLSPIGRWEAELSASWSEMGATLSGTWSSVDGDLRAPVVLSRAAEYVTTTTRQGAMIEVIAHYPYFSWGWDDVNALLSNLVQAEHQAFLREGQALSTQGRLFGSWTLAHAVEIRYYSDTLLSLLETVDTYMGGAHPHTNYGALNFWYDPENDAIVGLWLGDLFKADADFESTISDALVGALRAQQAGWLIDGQITRFTAEELSVFTLAPNGLTFTFAPYQVGSYAEGTYTVTIPWAELSPLLKPNGPAGHWR